MKKTYLQPTMQVITLDLRATFLTTSPFETVPIDDNEDEEAEFI